MSEYGLFDFFFDDSRERRHQEYLERQARREQRHQEYLERQARRERRHQEYLERQARREANRAAYFARISSNVQRFREQYGKILNEIRQQGLDSFIQEDFRSICKKVQQLDQLLALEDVEAARDLSFEIGQSIHGLIPRARRERQQQGLNGRRAGTGQQDSEIKRQARQDFIEQMRKNLELDKEDNPAAVQDAINKLDDLRGRTESMSDTELQDELMSESDKVDGAIADETVRREVIKAIYLTLKKTGFVVSDPQLTGDVVLLRARKPAGQQAEFKVELDGSLAFKFDNYEGQKCKKDIDEVTALLEDCYGVKLSNRRVLWSNPDRIQKGSKDNPAGGGKEQSSK
jgi:hypothetical protein